MRIPQYITLALLLVVTSVFSQHAISIDATLDANKGVLKIEQELKYHNSANIALDEIYFNDWANSFSTKTTPLAERFGENFKSSFHFEKDEDRGRTDIESILGESGNALTWQRGEELDILKVTLDKPLLAGESYTFKLVYTVKLPSDKFTRHGITNEGDYKIRYWYISPATFDGSWHAYSNKNTEDLYLLPSDFDIHINVPADFQVTSDFKTTSEEKEPGRKTFILTGKDRMCAALHIERDSKFESIVTDKVEIITNMKDDKVTPPLKALAVDRIVHYLDDKLGPYPFEKMLISRIDYKSSPVYGLNQLPDFISPFPSGFEYDMEMLKTITRNYLENTLSIHPRNDHWLVGALQIYLMMDYVDTYYPKMKIIGSLSEIWVVKWAHAADLEFNDQYPLLYLNMARRNLHQSLETPRDSLVKFNKNIASDYYAGNGMKYLSDYLGKEAIEKTIKQFYAENKLSSATPSEFKEVLARNTELPTDWFFEEYVAKRTTIDFKIKKVAKEGDSLKVTVRNLKNNVMPVAIYGINRDSTLFKKWLPPVDSIATITVPREGVRKLVLNKEAIIPEFNQRNNYKKVKGLFNRPVQFRLFQDVEDPDYNQLFFMPEFKYNLYDGFSFGPKLYNKTVLPKGVHYKITPQWGIRSKTLIGSASISYTERLDQDRLYSMRYGISGSLFSYNQDLFYRRLTPFITFGFRNPDLRNNEKQFINLRNVNVFRDLDPNDPDQEPNYSVFNAQYVFSNPNLINFFRGSFDYQISKKFSKISTTLEYRKLFISNRQLNVRLFAGAFLFNDSRQGDDFFSFALDRPTDYLFDYNYYGRSEEAGLFSQQIIVAEGGFKSQLQPAFADSWIATVNASTNIWKWIFAYGDAGLVHNRGRGTDAVFDTGVRLSLVADFFEVYLPLYSNLGWEPGLGDYDKRIRFIVTLDIRTLLGLFTREWY